MKKLLALILTLYSSFCFSQEAIQGIVLDDNNQPVFAANVYFSEDVAKGVVTGFEGTFTLLPPKDRTSVLVVSYVGFKTVEIEMTDLYSLEKPLRIVLEPSETSLKEVVLKYVSPIAKHFSVYKMSILEDVYLNPVAQGDPLKSITLYPASTTEDESASFSLRGSNPSLSQVTINGVPVRNPVRASGLNNQGLFSVLNPEVIASQNLYTSNPPLTYGNVGSGLLEIETTSTPENNTQLSLGLGNAGVLITKNLKKERSFIQLFSNYSFSRFFKATQSEQLPNVEKFETIDVGINFREQKQGKYSFNSYNYFLNEFFEGTVRQYNFQGDSNAKGHRFFTINNLNVFSKKGLWKFDFSSGFETSKSSFGNVVSDGKTKFTYLSTKHKTNLSEKIEVEAGGSYQRRQYSFDNTSPEEFYRIQPSDPTAENVWDATNTIIEGFMYFNLDVSNALDLSLGLRTNIPTTDQSVYLSSQFAMSFIPDDKNIFILSLGTYNVYNTPSYYALNNNRVTVQQASLDHTISWNKAAIKSAVYYKIEKGQQFNKEFFPFDNKETFGLEIFVEQELGTKASISLSNLFSNQTTQIYGLTVDGDYDFNYFYKILLKYNLIKNSSVSLIYVNRPGLNYNRIIGGEIDGGIYRPTFSEILYNARYRDYSRLDFSFNTIFRIKKKTIIAFATLNNILNAKNPQDSFYDSNYSNESFNFYNLRTVYFGIVLKL